MPKHPTYKFWRFRYIRAAREITSPAHDNVGACEADFLALCTAGHPPRPGPTAALEGSFDGKTWKHVGMLRINVFVDLGAKE